jgi:hypothetical protein
MSPSLTAARRIFFLSGLPSRISQIGFPLTSRLKDCQRAERLLKSQNSKTIAAVAARVGKNGALAVSARLRLDPTTIASTMSSAVCLPNARRPNRRISTRPNRKTSSARTLICHHRIAPLSLPIRS